MIFHGVFSVEKENRLNCKKCNHSVWVRIHVVQDDEGMMSEYGSDCFERLFGESLGVPTIDEHFTGKVRTNEEFYLLLFNTIKLRNQISSHVEHEDKPEKVLWIYQLNSYDIDAAKEEIKRKAPFINTESAGWSGLVKLVAKDIKTNTPRDWSWIVGHDSRIMVPQQAALL